MLRSSSMMILYNDALILFGRNGAVLRTNLEAAIDSPGLSPQWEKAEPHFMAFSGNLSAWPFYQVNSLNRSCSCSICFSEVDFCLKTATDCT